MIILYTFLLSLILAAWLTATPKLQLIPTKHLLICPFCLKQLDKYAVMFRDCNNFPPLEKLIMLSLCLQKISI